MWRARGFRKLEGRYGLKEAYYGCAAEDACEDVEHVALRTRECKFTNK